MMIRRVLYRISFVKVPIPQLSSSICSSCHWLNVSHQQSFPQTNHLLSHSFSTRIKRAYEDADDAIQKLTHYLEEKNSKMFFYTLEAVIRDRDIHLSIKDSIIPIFQGALVDFVGSPKYPTIYSRIFMSEFISDKKQLKEMNRQFIKSYLEHGHLAPKSFAVFLSVLNKMRLVDLSNPATFDFFMKKDVLRHLESRSGLAMTQLDYLEITNNLVKLNIKWKDLSEVTRANFVMKLMESREAFGGDLATQVIFVLGQLGFRISSLPLEAIPIPESDPNPDEEVVTSVPVTQESVKQLLVFLAESALQDRNTQIELCRSVLNIFDSFAKIGVERGDLTTSFLELSLAIVRNNWRHSLLPYERGLLLQSMGKVGLSWEDFQGSMQHLIVQSVEDTAGSHFREAASMVVGLAKLGYKWQENEKVRDPLFSAIESTSSRDLDSFGLQNVFKALHYSKIPFGFPLISSVSWKKLLDQFDTVGRRWKNEQTIEVLEALSSMGIDAKVDLNTRQFDRVRFMIQNFPVNVETSLIARLFVAVADLKINLSGLLVPDVNMLTHLLDTRGPELQLDELATISEALVRMSQTLDWPLDLKRLSPKILSVLQCHHTVTELIAGRLTTGDDKTRVVLSAYLKYWKSLPRHVSQKIAQTAEKVVIPAANDNNTSNNSTNANTKSNTNNKNSNRTQSNRNNGRV